MTTVERLKTRRVEQLKDRQAYRQALIQRREDIDGKIGRVEEQISKLRKPAEGAAQ
jgi:hypothetical protein